MEAWVDCSARIAAGAPGLPFHAYDLPAMTGIHLASDRFLAEATRRIPTMAGLKFSNPDLVLLQRCVAALARAADAIGETAEFERCRDLLDDCDPAARAELGLA